MGDKSNVFVIMPFQDEFFEVYEMLKIELSEKYEFTNAGDEGNQQNILRDIIEPIYKADVVIADLTGLNPNVMYELGIAHTFNKKTIIITKDDLSKLPFDLKQYRAKGYSIHFKKFAELIEYLKVNMDGAVSETVSYSNPVKDFMMLANLENTNQFQENVIRLEDDTDKGFLDFLADIEENSNALSEEINKLGEDIKTMTDGISKHVAEIDRVRQIGGNSVATFIRKESKKAAEYINKFAIQLRDHNQTIEKIWDEVENNTLGLLENKYANQEDNQNSLIEYLCSLKEMKNSITESNISVEKLKETMNKNIGIERSMNQAIRFVVGDLSTYLDNTQRIKKSIDKIIMKSKFVVGDLNDTGCQ